MVPTLVELCAEKMIQCVMTEALANKSVKCDTLARFPLPVPSLHDQRTVMTRFMREHNLPFTLQNEILRTKRFYRSCGTMVACESCDARVPLAQTIIMKAWKPERSSFQDVLDDAEHWAQWREEMFGFLHNLPVTEPFEINVRACHVCWDSPSLRALALNRLSDTIRVYIEKRPGTNLHAREETDDIWNDADASEEDGHWNWDVPKRTLFQEWQLAVITFAHAGISRSFHPPATNLGGAPYSGYKL